MKTRGAGSAFRLEVFPAGEDAYGLALFETPRNGSKPAPEKEQPVERLSGDPLKILMEQILGALKRGGHRPSEMNRSATKSFGLEEEDGVRLGLLFLALKPMRKISRMESIASQVRAMTLEEMYYWYAKTVSAETARRARRALRLLLAEE